MPGAMVVRGPLLANYTPLKTRRRLPDGGTLSPDRQTDTDAKHKRERDRIFETAPVICDRITLTILVLDTSRRRQYICVDRLHPMAGASSRGGTSASGDDREVLTLASAALDLTPDDVAAVTRYVRTLVRVRHQQQLESPAPARPRRALTGSSVLSFPSSRVR